MAQHKSRWIIVAIVAVVIAGGLSWLFMPRPVEADLAPVVQAPIDETVSDQGEARPRESFVVAAPVSGRLQRIDFEVGDRVAAGQVIARIDPVASDPLDARTLAQAQASVQAARAATSAAEAQSASARSAADLAAMEAGRVRTLAGRGVATQQALDNADAANLAAQAALSAAEAEVRARQADLARAEAAVTQPDVSAGRTTLVRAPASGYVTRVLQESARTVPAGAALVEIGQGQGLEAAIEFLSEDAVRIRPGMAAQVYDWGGPPIAARVRRVEPQGFTKVSALGVEEQRVLVLLTLDSEPDSLGAGYRVWARVFLRREPGALTVPLGALVRDGGGWAVFQAVGGQVRLAPIQVGAITDSAAEVRGGLKAGDLVVVYPSDKIAAGVRVRRRPTPG